MNDNEGFLAELEQAMGQKRTEIENKTLPDLKIQFQAFYNSYQSIYNVLLKKSLIKEDPYKYDKKASEITVPTQSPFLESEKSDQMSIRLSDYDNQLDFLTNYYQFSIDFLTMQRIKKMAGLTKYIRWDQVTESSTNMNTRAVAEFIGKIKNGSDTLSIQIISDSLNQLGSISKKIFRHLKELTEFHKQNYKLTVRTQVVQPLSITREKVVSKEAEVMKQIKRKYAEEMHDQPYYEELIKEIIQEDFGENGEQLRSEILESLKVKETKEKKKKPEESFKTMLLDAARTLATASSHMDQAVDKLNESHYLLINRTMSFRERLIKWLRRIAGMSEEKQIYEIEYFDTHTATSQHERIDFNAFIESVLKRARILAGLSNRMNAGYQRLEGLPEEQIYRFLNTNISELQLILRRLPALDTYFKTEIPKDQRNKIRGIKIETNAIKNSMIKANKRKHEYVSKKEELEQLKRLGIKTEE